MDQPFSPSEISRQIYQALLAAQATPSLLSPKARSVDWRSPEKQAWFLQKFVGWIQDAVTVEALRDRVRQAMTLFFSPEYFAGPDYISLLEAIAPYPRSQAEPENCVVPNTIALLLLDVENLKLSAAVEEFLQQLCPHPITVKIAFGDWKKLGKYDVEFHNRQYQLVQVPAGQDHADVKMAAVGSSLFVHYPNVRAAFVCSSDGALQNLCNELSARGLRVFAVKQHGEIVAIEDYNSHQRYTYPPADTLPSLSTVSQWLRSLLQEQQKTTGRVWLPLTDVLRLLSDRHTVDLPSLLEVKVPPISLDSWLHEQSELVFYTDDDQQGYLTLFDPDFTHPKTPPTLGAISLEIFEQQLIVLSRMFYQAHPEERLTVGKLGHTYRETFGQKVSDVLKVQQSELSFLSFLKSRGSFSLLQDQQQWIVALVETVEPARENSAEAIASQGTSSNSSKASKVTLKQFEQALINAIKQNLKVERQSAVPIEVIAKVLSDRFHKGVSQILREDLQQTGTFIKFLHSHSKLQVTYTGKRWLVAIAPGH